jgi:hypothetical protein
MVALLGKPVSKFVISASLVSALAVGLTGLLPGQQQNIGYTAAQCKFTSVVMKVDAKKKTISLDGITTDVTALWKKGRKFAYLDFEDGPDAAPFIDSAQKPALVKPSSKNVWKATSELKSESPDYPAATWTAHYCV